MIGFWSLCSGWAIPLFHGMCIFMNNNTINTTSRDSIALPMYSEAKLAFFIYLWYPKTKGTDYVYNVSLRPYVAKHEKEIDLNLLKLRIKARDISLLFWEKAAI
ncbi:hypothetical protein CUMW_257630 [Citrus unshiu]|uniref:HVA22-like protein n=1 Tax=Citrus unshiu TaxID=55188 RepID=A0A2H5QSI6_CITUN|nr:hypothetical protein CUMW_257630 [Citrus unshiu]